GFPAPLVPVLATVRRIGAIDVEVFAVRREDRQSPRTELVVPDRDAGNRRFAATDHVPTRRDEMHQIAKRWHRLDAMWIVGHHRSSTRREPSAPDPVVAADVSWVRKIVRFVERGSIMVRLGCAGGAAAEAHRR